jgi:glycosyltransferase involved in cell wall biosynthesis
LGHEASVLTFSSSIDKENVKRIYHVQNVPNILSLKRFESFDYWPPRGSSLKDLTIWLVRGSRIIMEEEPDLVIINGIVPLLKLSKTKYIAVAHQVCPHIASDLGLLGLAGLRILYKIVPDVAVAITSREKKCLEEYLGIKPVVIPLCINTRRFRVARLEEREKMILHVGVYGPKNLEFTLKVFNSLCSRDDVKLCIVGGYDENHLEMLRSIVKDDCRNRVIFMGRISKEKLIELYSKSRVLLAPSLYEGLPYVSLEAQASGTPVVASRAIPPEAVLDNITGYRIDLKDFQTFKDKVHALLTDDILWEEMSKRARKHAESFDSIVIAKQYLDIFEESKRRDNARTLLSWRTHS